MIGHCTRCNSLCQTDSSSNSNARILKRSNKVSYCVNCATTSWLKNTPLVSVIIKRGASILLDDKVAKRFGAILKAANSDANINEIDWQQVVKHWDLPM